MPSANTQCCRLANDLDISTGTNNTNMKDKKEMYKFSVMHTGFVPYLKVGVQSEPEKN